MMLNFTEFISAAVSWIYISFLSCITAVVWMMKKAQVATFLFQQGQFEARMIAHRLKPEKYRI